MSKPSNEAKPGDYIKLKDGKHAIYGQVIISFGGADTTYKVFADMYPGANPNYEYLYFPYNFGVQALNEYKVEDFDIIDKLPENME